MKNDNLTTELLIIGTGIAGLTAAIYGAKLGYKVLIINRSSQLEESNTLYAQGGIAYQGEEDSAKIFAKDINIAGDKIGCFENIEILVKEGPEIVKKFLLEEVGMPFDKTKVQKLNFTKEAAHSINRILHVSDFTGKVIQASLIKSLKKYPNIKILTNHTAIDLITPGHQSSDFQDKYRPLEVSGAYLFNRNSKEVKIILANQTILATGGVGQCFLYTSNPEGARGDGIAMALRAGARVINLEYIQFHPTCFYCRTGERFLISETVRGEGGILLNRFKKPFTNSLAPRDEVSRAIYQEMIKTESDSVFLDLTPIKKRGIKLQKRFSTIYEKCLNYGIDIEKDLIPVVPAAHYSCGGVWVDGWGRTNLKNLYAIGEVACTGVHGANRLAGTSLLEGLLWGKRCIENIDKNFQNKRATNRIMSWIDTGTKEADEALILQDWITIRTTMWNYVGVVRNSERLERADEDLHQLNRQVEKFYRTSNLSDNLIGLRNGALVARLIVGAALKNSQNKGCHYRID